MNEPQKPTIEDALATIITVQEATGISITRLDATIDSLKADMNRRFDLVDNRFDEVYERFDGVDKRFDGLDQRLDRIETLITQIVPKKRKRPQDRD